MSTNSSFSKIYKVLTVFLIAGILISSTGSSISSVHAQGAATVTLGDPGLSFRYLRTIGKTGIPYFSDTTHLNRPIGLFMDGNNNLYVTEDSGQRVLKYSPAKSNLLKLGQAGICITDTYIFCSPKDVALDGTGNIWVADGNRVVEYDAGGAFIQQMPDTDPWASGDDDTHFNYVNGIAFDSTGRMYVSDTNNHRVQVYTFTAGAPVYSATIGVTGEVGDDNDHFSSPHRLAVDSSDRLYVADRDNNRVQRCEFSGAWTCSLFDSGIGGPQGLTIDANDNVYIGDLYNGRIRKCPGGGACVDFAIGTYGYYDLAVDSNGNVYASATYEAMVVKYNSAGTLLGTFLGKKFVPYLTDQYHYFHPRVAIDKANNIIIVEENGHRLTKLSASGVPQWSRGVPGVDAPDNKHFTYPHGVATDNSGKIYVADSCRVQIFSPTGSYLSTLGTGCGTGDYEFGWITGVDVDQNGKIYVVDYPNHRVQIYTSNHLYAGRIGVTGECSTANDRLCTPIAVDVDAGGNIYVTDGGNLRLQKFNSSLEWQMTIGDGTWGSSFEQLSWPEDVAVDSQGRIFVSDWTNNRVQVFDASGAYLTTIGGSWGSNSSQLRGAPGVDVDSSGNVYVADWENHRIQKFSPGVAGWKQTNINGFGDPGFVTALSMTVFNDQLYAGAATWNGTGASIWRTSDGSNWSSVMTSGFGFPDENPAVIGMIAFDGKIYAGTGWSGAPGQLWRSSNGTSWDQITGNGMGVSTGAMGVFAIHSNTLYAGTCGANGINGAQIWRSTTGDNSTWTSVVTDGNTTTDNTCVTGLKVFNGSLYASVENQVTGAQIWRSTTGNAGSWAQVNTSGFGAASNDLVGGFAVFNGYLYIGTHNVSTGAQLWRSSDGTTWNPVMTNGFGDVNNTKLESLFVFGNGLYAGTNNAVTGLEVWHSTNGTVWSQINPDGFGDSNSDSTLWSNEIVMFNSELYLGVNNNANGTEIWKSIRPAVMNINTVTDTGDGSLSEGEQVIVPVTKLTVTFNEDIKPPAAAMFTLKMGTTLIAINSVTYDSLTRTATLNINNGKKLPFGTYILTIKKTIVDTEKNSMAVNVVRRFTLVKPPGAPTLLSPANKALINTLQPKLDWSNSSIPAGTTFDHYQLQLATDAAFTSPVEQNTGISEFTLLSPLTAGTKYYWRVRAYNTLGQASAWSAVFSFTTP